MLKQIPIFFTFNNDYVIPAAVAFYSLLNKAKSDIFYEMYVLHSDITIENQNLLQNIVKNKGNANLTFKNTNGFLQDLWDNGNFEGHNTKTQFTSDTIIRCFGAKFFPQYDKIIYSDVDIVIVDDISELIDINLDNKYIAAVKDAFMQWDKNELSHLRSDHYEKFKDSYFAGGIWVMNLKKIREDHLENKMIEIIKDDSIVKRWNDMDIMNIACDNKVEFIPLNYISYPYLRERILQKDFISHYSRDELYDSLINPKIIHYAAIKPWNGSPNKAEIWWEIFDYLDLPKNKIFKTQVNNEELNRFIKKYYKYKNLFKIFLTISIILLLSFGLFLFK